METITLYPSKDSKIQEHSPNNNYGASDLSVRPMQGEARRIRSLIEFDLSSIPAGATINSAELGLYCYDVYGGGISIDSSDIVGQWEENTVTWNNQPSSGNVYLIIEAYAQGQWYIGDVTALVQQKLHDSEPFSAFLMATNESDPDYKGARFYSKDDSSNWPYLTINYSTTVQCADYTTQTECESAGCYWYDGSCHSIPQPEKKFPWEYLAIGGVAALGLAMIFIPKKKKKIPSLK